MTEHLRRDWRSEFLNLRDRFLRIAALPPPGGIFDLAHAGDWGAKCYKGAVAEGALTPLELWAHLEINPSLSPGLTTWEGYADWTVIVSIFAATMPSRFPSNPHNVTDDDPPGVTLYEEVRIRAEQYAVCCGAIVSLLRTVDANEDEYWPISRFREKVTCAYASFADKVRQAAHQGRIRSKGSGRRKRYCVVDVQREYGSDLVE